MGGGGGRVPVIPIVVYHGAKKWTAPRSLGELFAGPEPLRAYWPELRFELTDLSLARSDPVRGTVALQVHLLLMQRIFDAQLGAMLRAILAQLRAVPEQSALVEYLEAMLTYVMQASGAVTRDELREAATAAFPDEGGELMTTLAETWLKEGEQKGRQEGIREGARTELLSGIELALDLKFGGLGLALMPEIAAIGDVDLLRAVRDAIRTAATPDALRRLYRQ